MLHLFTDGSIGVLNYLLCIYMAFKTHPWMVGMQARLTNCTLLSLQPTSHSPTHLSAFLFMNYIFPTKMQTFESNNEITISTTTLNCGEPLVLKLSVFFLKSINLEVPKLTAHLNGIFAFVLSQGHHIHRRPFRSIKNYTAYDYNIALHHAYRHH